MPIGCDVCQIVAPNLWEQVAEMAEDYPTKKVPELELIGLLESLCDPKNSTTGSWMRELDITTVTNDDGKSKRLGLVAPGGMSKCGAECATIAKSCDLLMNDELFSQDDLLGALHKRKLTAAQFEVSDLRSCKSCDDVVRVDVGRFSSF